MADMSLKFILRFCGHCCFRPLGGDVEPTVMRTKQLGMPERVLPFTAHTTLMFGPSRHVFLFEYVNEKHT